MPKVWLYFIALIVPLVLRVLILNTGFVEWLWYQGHVESYNWLSVLRVQPQFIEFIGGWALPVFVITVFSYWTIEGNEEGIQDQFLLLPIAYIPFTLIGEVLLTGEFHVASLYVHPLVVIPIGYLYIMIWALFIRVLDKLQLVL